MPAGGVTIRTRAALGISLRHYRPGREVLAGLGQVKVGNARNNCGDAALERDVTDRR